MNDYKNNGSEMLTILFADVAGSVNLYETYGDTGARNKIVECLEIMSIAIKRHSGYVAETIGDEIMCIFLSPNNALKAACNIQEFIQDQLDQPLGVRIGFHHGLTYIEHNNLPFGDTVNIASRMVNYAKAGQIILSQQTIDALTPEAVKQTRFLNQVYIKGKSDPINIHEAEWDESNSTQMLELTQTKRINRRKPIIFIKLHYAGKEFFAYKSSAEFTMGRGKICDLIIPSKTASRLHITLRCQHDKITIKDHSINGSYINTTHGKRKSDGDNLFIRNEECTVQGQGVISLGQPITDNNAFLISFQCMQTTDSGNPEKCY